MPQRNTPEPGLRFRSPAHQTSRRSDGNNFARRPGAGPHRHLAPAKTLLVAAVLGPTPEWNRAVGHVEARFDPPADPVEDTGELRAPPGFEELPPCLPRELGEPTARELSRIRMAQIEHQGKDAEVGNRSGLLEHPLERMMPEAG